jgi:3-hydroxybutyryl-CoA dehydrogenase
MEELKQKFSFDPFTANDQPDPDMLNSYDVIFDLNADDHSNALAKYSGVQNKLIVLCSVKKTLGKMIQEVDQPLKNNIAGMNLLLTFIHRSKMEVCFPDVQSREAFTVFAAQMKMEFLEVDDSVGMVTARVICMIINEACFSAEQGIASIADIDKAMKLGTNYPFGPLEWCDRIGVKDVYETLLAISHETGDPRYEISAWLKEKYLKRQRLTAETLL